jgi:hypothetical protein
MTYNLVHVSFPRVTFYTIYRECKKNNTNKYDTRAKQSVRTIRPTRLGIDLINTLPNNSHPRNFRGKSCLFPETLPVPPPPLPTIAPSPPRSPAPINPLSPPEFLTGAGFRRPREALSARRR